MPKYESRGSTTIGAQQADVAQLIQAEAERVGLQQILAEIERSARSALADLPGTDEINKLSPLGQRYIEQVSRLLELGSHAARWDEDELNAFVQEVAWGRLLVESTVAVYTRPGFGGGGEGPTCVTLCQREYDRCINEHNCDEDSWICICCSACSLQYMGCVAKCVVVGRDLGMFIA